MRLPRARKVNKAKMRAAMKRYYKREAIRKHIAAARLAAAKGKKAVAG